MGKLAVLILTTMVLFTPLAAHATLFDFDNAPPMTSLPIDLTAEGITAHFSDTGQGFSIQAANTMGFTPVGFGGFCIYPNSINAADLLVSFSQTMTDFSILYSPQELGCDDSATMRVTAYQDAIYLGTATTTASAPGTWPTETLAFSSTQGFNNVVVHYESRPPTCQDYGVIFMADNMNVTPLVDPAAASPAMAHSAQAPVTSPNPFGEATTVRFSVARTGPVSAWIHDAQGRLVRTLAEGAVFKAGRQSLRWDGRDNRGDRVPDGVYLCSVQTVGGGQSARLILLRDR